MSAEVIAALCAYIIAYSYQCSLRDSSTYASGMDRLRDAVGSGDPDPDEGDYVDGVS